MYGEINSIAVDRQRGSAVIKFNTVESTLAASRTTAKFHVSLSRGNASDKKHVPQQDATHRHAVDAESNKASESDKKYLQWKFESESCQKQKGAVQRKLDKEANMKKLLERYTALLQDHIRQLTNPETEPAVKIQLNRKIANIKRNMTCITTHLDKSKGGQRAVATSLSRTSFGSIHPDHKETEQRLDSLVREARGKGVDVRNVLEGSFRPHQLDTRTTLIKFSRYPQDDFDKWFVDSEEFMPERVEYIRPLNQATGELSDGKKPYLVKYDSRTVAEKVMRNVGKELMGSVRLEWHDPRALDDCKTEQASSSNVRESLQLSGNDDVTEAGNVETQPFENAVDDIATMSPRDQTAVDAATISLIDDEDEDTIIYETSDNNGEVAYSEHSEDY
eukprot:Selendium_serpulae@DN5949_c0_g1_i1.p1